LYFRVKSDILVQLKLKKPSVFTWGFDRPNIRYEVRYKGV